MALPIRHTDNENHTNLHPWSPYGELERLHRQLTSLIDHWNPSADGLGFRPLADLEEQDDAYIVEIELPGVKRDHVNIEIAGRRLTVHGERKDKERVGILRKRERTRGRFNYEVLLPSDIDDNNIDAQLDNGILTIWLPKPERERPRQIEIH